MTDVCERVDGMLRNNAETEAEHPDKAFFRSVAIYVQFYRDLEKALRQVDGLLASDPRTSFSEPACAESAVSAVCSRVEIMLRALCRRDRRSRANVRRTLQRLKRSVKFHDLLAKVAVENTQTVQSGGTLGPRSLLQSEVILNEAEDLASAPVDLFNLYLLVSCEGGLS